MAFIKKGHTSVTKKQIAPGLEKNLREFRVVLIVAEDETKGQELVADGTSTLLDLLQDSPFFQDLDSMKAVPAEPEVGTEEHAAWTREYAGLAAVPKAGTKIILSGTILMEGYEEA